jgi:hypothetical protein
MVAASGDSVNTPANAAAAAVPRDGVEGSVTCAMGELNRGTPLVFVF